MVEIKIPLAVPDGTDNFIWKGFYHIVRQMAGYCSSSYCGDKGKRNILLTIYQHGTKHIFAMVDENTKKELEKAIGIIQIKFCRDGNIKLEHYFNHAIVFTH